MLFDANVILSENMQDFSFKKVVFSNPPSRGLIDCL